MAIAEKHALVVHYLVSECGADLLIEDIVCITPVCVLATDASVLDIESMSLLPPGHCLIFWDKWPEILKFQDNCTCILKCMENWYCYCKSGTFGKMS